MPYCHNVGLSETLIGKYNSALVCIQYFIPLCIISFAYLRMALTLRTEKDDCAVSIARVNGLQIRQKKKKVNKIFFSIKIFCFKTRTISRFKIIKVETHN